MQIAVASSISLLPTADPEATATSILAVAGKSDGASKNAKPDFAAIWAEQTGHPSDPGVQPGPEQHTSESQSTNGQSIHQQSPQTKSVEMSVPSIAEKPANPETLDIKVMNVMEKSEATSRKDGANEAPVLFDALVTGRKSTDGKIVQDPKSGKEKATSGSKKSNERIAVNLSNQRNDSGLQVDKANVAVPSMSGVNQALKQPDNTTTNSIAMQVSADTEKSAFGNPVGAISGVNHGKRLLVQPTGGRATAKTEASIALQGNYAMPTFQKVTEVAQAGADSSGTAQKESSDKAGNVVASQSANLVAGAPAITDKSLSGKDLSAAQSTASTNEAKSAEAVLSDMQASGAPSTLPQNGSVVEAVAPYKSQLDPKQDLASAKTYLPDASKDGSGGAIATQNSTHAIESMTAAAPVVPNGNHPVTFVTSSSAPAVTSANHAVSSATENPFVRMDAASGSVVGNATTHQVLMATPRQLEVGVADTGHGWIQVRAEMTGAGTVHASLGPTTTGAEQQLRDALPGMTSYLSDQQLSINKLVVHPASGSAQSAMSFTHGGGSSPQNGQGNQSGGSLQQASTGMGAGADSHDDSRRSFLLNPQARTGMVSMTNTAAPSARVDHIDAVFGIEGRLSVRA